MNPKIYDFDNQTQYILNSALKNFQKINWKKWFSINSTQEYEELALKNSGLYNIPDIYEKIKKKITESRNFSVNPHYFITNQKESEQSIICHTSGTTNSNPDGLKWFYMSKELIYNLWAPGMQAIFESSGLKSSNSAIIFVPSRMNFDGYNDLNGRKYIFLYTAEFSQRIVIAIFKPESYLFAQYKDSKDLCILSRILEMKNISVISAPAATILGWADIKKLEEGIRISLRNLNVNYINGTLERFLAKIKIEGIHSVALEIQKALSEKISQANLIFGVSSLSTKQWEILKKFLKWKKDEKNYTSLYVASEIGPFASNLNSKIDGMYIFPLTLPAIEYNGKIELVSRTKNKIGRLLVSRIQENEPLININTDDVINIKDQALLPLIQEKILRNGFQLKYSVNISKKIKLPKEHSILAGDFFILNGKEIYEPRMILNHLREKCRMNSDSMLLNITNLSNWKLILPKSSCQSREKIFETLQESNIRDISGWLLNNDYIDIITIEEQPIQFMKNRTEILSKVREGKIPKGILKKWPLYIIIPN